MKVFGTMAKNPKDDLEYHFIYSEDRHDYIPNIKSCIKKVITEFKLASAIFTQVNMNKHHLVTKETMEKLYKNEKYTHDIYSYDDLKESVGDDLESFFMNLQIGKLKDDSRTFYLPKILPSERKMIEERSINCLYGLDHYGISLKISSWTSFDPLISLVKKEMEMIAMDNVDVSKVEMDLSESNSKYMLCICDRRTVRLPEEKYAARKLKHETK